MDDHQKMNQIIALHDQAWAIMRDAHEDIRRIGKDGIQSELDLILAQMVCSIVDGELTIRKDPEFP